MGARFCAFLAKVTWHWVPTQQAVFLAQVFLHQAIIQVHGVLDWLSSVFGAKIMAQKPKFCKKIKSHKR